MKALTRSIAQYLQTALLLLAVMAVTGCANHSETVAVRDTVPVLEAAEETPPYRMQVGDVLAIRFLLNPEFNEDVTIRPDGKISTAVVQNIPASGLTPLALQQELDKHYRLHLSNPDTAVIVKDFAPTRIYVLGEVNAPGEYSFDRAPTLLQAIARAGGLKNSARGDEIIIKRRGYEDESNIYTANYDLATSGLNPRADVRLAAHDVVYVPRTGVAKAYVQFEQYIQQFLRPAIGFGF